MADIIKYAFIAGEISPTLYGRTDLTKYDLAVAEARNVIVDYRGGLSSRPGFEFIDFVDGVVRLIPFNFSTDLSNSYVVIFGNGWVRFMQDGGYVLDDPVDISDVAYNGTVTTSSPHGLELNNLVRLADVGGMDELAIRTFRVKDVTPITFRLYTVDSNIAVDAGVYGTYTSGGTVSKVYEVTSPYYVYELDDLSFEQYRDTIRITSFNHPIRNLTRNAHNNWVFSDEVISELFVGPAFTGYTFSEAGQANTVFAVTSVYEDGTESVPGPLGHVTGVVNYPATEGSISVTWAHDSAAKYYNVYRSIVSVSEDLLEGTDLGYVGRAFGTKFTDPNIIPDFTRVPPVNINPFAPGAIIGVEITNGGSGYTNFNTDITITADAGYGFSGQVITNDAGEVVNVIIKCGGQLYVNPVMTFTGGTGATATLTVRPLTGTYPSQSAIFQQRQWYAASENEPVTLWGSRIKQLNNFSSSDLVLEDDALDLTLDTNSVSAIRHLLVTRGGLLAFTQENVWQISGSQGGALTPTTALADPQSYNGTSKLKPIKVDADILFFDERAHAVRMLSYEERYRTYGSDDRSILANHMFGPGKDIKAWAYQSSPFKIVWAVREDGMLLAFTVVKNEDIFAWTLCSTRGKFLDIICLREGNEDRVYALIERTIEGQVRWFIERMDLRQFTNVEDSFCVDAGLKYEPELQPGGIIIRYLPDDDLWQAFGTSLEGNEGKILRAAGGIFRVEEAVSTDVTNLHLIARPTDFVPETNETLTFPQYANWSLSSEVTSITGLYHLEGETVSILADGNVLEPRQVVNGTVSVPEGVTKAVIGLAYNCRIKTLPVVAQGAVVEGKRRRVVGVAVRLDKSRGVSIGPTLDRMFPMRDRTYEDLGNPIRMINGIEYQLIPADYSTEGQTYFTLTEPVPMTLLSVVLDMEIGDEQD